MPVVDALDRALTWFHNWRTGKDVLEQRRVPATAAARYIDETFDRVEAVISRPVDPKFPLGEPDWEYRDLWESGFDKLLGTQWTTIGGNRAGSCLYDTVAWHDSDRVSIERVRHRDDGDTYCYATVTYQPVYINHDRENDLVWLENLGSTPRTKVPAGEYPSEPYVPKTRTNTFIHRVLKIKGEIDRSSGGNGASLDSYIPDPDTDVDRAISLLERTETVESAVPANIWTSSASGERYPEPYIDGKQAAADLQEIADNFVFTWADLLVTDEPLLQYKLRFGVERPDAERSSRATYTAQPEAFDSEEEIYAFLEEREEPANAPMARSMTGF